MVVADGFTLPCTQMIQQLDITLGRNKAHDDFYVVGIGEMDVVLGVQWLRSLGEFI